MEQRIIQKVKDGGLAVKTNLLERIQGCTMEEAIEIIRSTEPYTLTPNDFNKRRRNTVCVVEEHRCTALRAKKDQCTRRRKDGEKCCGTHCKGAPHGYIDSETAKTFQREVWPEDIKGIQHYIDKEGNVYKTEDVLKNCVNPRIIAKWTKQDSIYTLHYS
jgi:hypothetical protein